jgi:hypothetical protein
MTARKWIGIVSMVLVSTLGLAPAQLSAATNGYTLEDIKLKSAGDLVDICTVDSTHADYAAALGFCYGFFEGAIRYQQAIAGTDIAQDLVCAPEGTTRLEAVEVFVSFMREKPQYATEGSVDAIYRALMARWPCSPQK